MKLIHVGDMHFDHPVMTLNEFSFKVADKIIAKVEEVGDELDLITINGDTFHKFSLPGSMVVKSVRDFFTKLCLLSKIHKFKIRVIEGTHGHEKGMLDNLMDLTKYGKIYRTDMQSIESKLISKVSNLKDHFADMKSKGGSDELLDTLKMVYEVYHDASSDDEGEADMMVYRTITRETICGLVFLFIPEHYAESDTELKEALGFGADVVCYHGMVDGAIKVLEGREDSSGLKYNKSIPVKKEWLGGIKKYMVCAHVHNRYFMTPYTSDIYGTVVNPRLWYTGSPNAHNASDAGQRKGFDLVTISENKHWVDFIEITGTPKFEVIDFTHDLKRLGLNELVVKYLRKLNESKDTSIRLDVESVYLNENHMNKLKEFRVRFKKSYKFKITKHKDMERSKQIADRSKYMMSKSILDIAAELSGISKDNIEKLLKN